MHIECGTGRTFDVEVIHDAARGAAIGAHEGSHLLHDAVPVAQMHGWKLEAQEHCHVVEAAAACPAQRHHPCT